MPRRGEAQRADHPWRKVHDASVKNAMLKRQRATNATKTKTERRAIECPLCGDLECAFGECAGGDY